MCSMRRFIYLICLCLLAIASNAQNKVIERSAKKLPEWMNTAVDDYLIVSVTANSLAEAQAKVMDEITERIIRAVASNVTVEQKSVLSEVNVNGSIDSKDDFSRVSKIRSANLPFLKGISSAKIADIYWQKVQDKATKREHYDYSAKYPFSKAEQRGLVAQFEALDAEKVARYKALEEKINEIEAVEEIKNALTELEALQGYFFDEVRLNQVKGLKERYRQLYDALSVTGTFLEEGKFQCQLLLDGNPVRVSSVPKVTSNCAAQIAVRPSEGRFVITYDAIDCLPEEENFLHIQFRIAGKRLEHKAYIREAGGAGSSSFSVVPEGKLIFTADSVLKADRKIFNIHIRLTLNNRGGTPFGLKALEFRMPELSAPIVFDDIDAVYSTKGILQVKALAEGAFTVLETKKSAFSFVQGAMTLVNPQSGAVERVKISLPYVTNWE